jgi:hypothetical protein
MTALNTGATFLIISMSSEYNVKQGIFSPHKNSLKYRTVSPLKPPPPASGNNVNPSLGKVN